MDATRTHGYQEPVRHALLWSRAAILTQRAARGESGRLWRRSSRGCRRRLMSGNLSLPSGKVFSQQAERRGLARLAADFTLLSPPKLTIPRYTNKDYDTGGTWGCAGFACSLLREQKCKKSRSPTIRTYPTTVGTCESATHRH